MKEFTIVDTNKKNIKLVIRKPNYEDIEQADKVYAVKVASLVRENSNKRLLLRSQIDDFLKQAGIWTKDDDTKVRKLHSEINSLISKIAGGGMKLSEGRKICIDVMQKRREIIQTTMKRQVFDDTTIESMAEAEKIDYFIYSCTVYSDSGKNYWESFEDMKNDKLSEVYRRSYSAALELIYNVSPDFEKEFPENKWLRKYSFIDKELNYIDRKTGRKVDQNGIPVDVETPEVPAVQEELPFIDDETDLPVAIEPIEPIEQIKEELVTAT